MCQIAASLLGLCPCKCGPWKFDINRTRKVQWPRALLSCAIVPPLIPARGPWTLTLEEQLLSPYKVYDDEYCKQLPWVYVDGCAYHHKVQLQLVAGIGIIWTQGVSPISVRYKLGPRSSQVAELAAILKAVEMAIDYCNKEFAIITNSNYVRNSFVEYLTRWK